MDTSCEGRDGLREWDSIEDRIRPQIKRALLKLRDLNKAILLLHRSVLSSPKQDSKPTQLK